MSKMVADWFATGKIATAMAIYVNSWPMGIALALLVLPWVANIGGLSIALGLSAAFCAGGLALMTTLYRNPPKPVTQMPKGSWPKGSALTGVLLAGSVWGFYNGALAMVFVFGPPLLIARGASLTEASGISSLVLWIAVFSIPIGGLLADRLGRADAILLAGLAAFAATFAFALAQTGLPPFILMGLCCGLSAGPIMALPARVLRPETRALGMGIFFSLYYLWMSLLPALAGTVAETIGGVESAFVLGIAMLGLAAIGVLILRMPRFIAT
jgi:MFS family permease